MMFLPAMSMTNNTSGMESDPEVNKSVLKDLLHQFDKTQEQESAAMEPKIRRTIMKSPITKLAAPE